MDSIPVNLPGPLGSAGSSTPGIPSTTPTGTYIPGTSLTYDITSNVLTSLCSVTSPTLSALSSAQGNTATPSVGVGDPVLLLGLVPAPGASLFSRDRSVVEALPPDSVVSTKWTVRYQDSATEGWKEARPANSSSDVSGQYQIIDGSLNSPFLSILPWPYPDVTDKPTIRKFQGILTISIWVPAVAKTVDGKPGTNGPIVINLSSLSWTVESWASVLGPVDQNSEITVPAIPNTPTTKITQILCNFKDLFHVKLDTTTPVIGAPVTLQLLAKDKSITDPMTVDNIVQSTPETKVQAALDIGAPIENLINVAKKAVSGLFGGGSSPIPSQAVNGVLDVGSVLAGAISIPLAVDVKNQTLSKTLRPVANLVSPVMSAVPNTSSLQGVLPIGSLATALKMTSNDLLASISSEQPIGALPPERRYITSSPLTSALGLSITPMPLLVSPDDQNGSYPKLGVKINPKAKLSLPGLDHDITLSLPSIYIEINPPVLPIPQIAIFLKNTLNNYDPQDVLIAMDRDTSRLLPNASLVTSALKAVITGINTLANIFPGQVINSMLLRADDFLPRRSTEAVVSCMLQVLGSAKSVTIMRPPFPASMFNEIGTAGQQPFPDGWKEAINAVLYIGIPSLASHTLMVLNNGNANNGNDNGYHNVASAFGFADAADTTFLSAVVLGAQEASDTDNRHVSRGVWWYDFSGDASKGGTGATSGQHVQLNWSRPSAVWGHRFLGIEWTSRYELPAKWVGGPKIPQTRS